MSPIGVPPASLELLSLLVESTGVEVDSTAQSEVLERSSNFQEALESIGLRVRWIRAPLQAVGPLARRTQPVVGWSTQGSPWLLDGASKRGFRAVSVTSPRKPRWRSEAELTQIFGAEPTRWALVEPALPAAAMSSKGSPRTPSQRLAALLWLERRDGVVVMIYGLITGLLSLATPLAIQVLINWLAFGALLQPIILLGGLLLLSLSIVAGLRLLQRVAIETIERRIFVRMVSDLTTRLARVEASALDGLHGPELANRFFDVLTLQKAIRSLLLDGFTALLQIGVAVILLGLYNPWLLVFDVLLLLGMYIVLVPLGRNAEYTAIKESKAKYAVAAWIEEISRHSVALRMNRAEIAEGKSERLALAWLEQRTQHFRIVLRQYAGVQSFQALMSVALLIACGILVMQGQLTIGQLVAAEFIVNSALTGLVKFADKLDTLYDLMAGIDKLGALLDLPAESPDGLGVLPTSEPAEIELVELPHNTRELSLHLQPGSKTVLLTPPGDRHQELVQAIAGLRDPSKGIVRRDGTAVRLLRPSARYETVALIHPSDLIHGSIRENISLGNPQLTEHDIWHALAEVQLRERVEELGLQTIIPPQGGPLSIAEQRAILVARAIINQPRLVVADGILDGLPRANRDHLQQTLLRATAPWTSLLFTAEPFAPLPGVRAVDLRTQDGSL